MSFPWRLASRNTDIFRCRAELMAVQMAAITRKGSTFFVSCCITEKSAILCVALKIYQLLAILLQRTVSRPESLLTIAATIGCNARKLALKYLFSKPAKVYK